MAFAGTTRFSLLAKLGEGGMGIVYEAYDHSRDMRVALKTLRHADPAHIYHFKREFRALSDLSHPNIITLYELLSEGGYWFLTMELVDGPDFMEHVRGNLPTAAPAPGPVMDDQETRTSAAHDPGLFSALRDAAGAMDDAVPAPMVCPEVTRVVDLERLQDDARQLAGALDALHAAGMVHRDLKPSNVRVTSEGRVVLMDFGIVAEIRNSRMPPRENGAVGTPSYMAPEQVAGGQATAAADWYSFGVMLYKALCGRLPHEGVSAAIMRAKTERDPLPPSAFVAGIPRELERLCMDLLVREPESRPGYHAVLEALGAPPAPGHEGAGVSRAPQGDFVGRVRELGLLEEAYERARAGEGVCVLVQGESGMGKTHLVQRFLEEVQARPEVDEPLVLTGRCHERETLSYKALDGVMDSVCHYLMGLPGSERAAIVPADAPQLSRVFPVLLQVMSPDTVVSLEGRNPMEVRVQAVAAVRALLAGLARYRPTVVCIEDLQWADSDSLDVLLALLRPPAPRGLLVVATVRSESLHAGVNPRLCEAHAALSWQDHCRTMCVGPLSDAEQRELLATLEGRRGVRGAVPDRLRQESAGHPMLLVELVRYLQDEDGGAGARALHLEDVIWRRVARLPAAARTLMEVIAVAGEPLPSRVLAAASNLSGAGCERAATLVCVAHLARVSKMEHEPWLDRFHDKVREAVLERLPSERVRFLHVQLAHALESWADAPVASMAHHWLAAGDRQQAALYLLEAGRTAAQKLAFERAGALYRAGLALIPAGACHRRLEVARCRAWIGLAEGMRMLDRDGASLALLDRAEQAATALKLHAELATLHSLRGTLLFPRGDQAGCLAEHEKAHAYARKARSAEGEARALSGLGDAHYLGGRMISAHEHFSRCLEVCDRHGFASIRAANLPMRGLTHYYQGNLEAALRDGREAASLAVRIGHQHAEIVARSTCIPWVLLEMGRLDEARREYERALHLMRVIGARRFESFVLSGQARVLALEHHPDEAASMARRSVAVSRQTGLPLGGPMALGVLALVTRDAGERARALGEALAVLRAGAVGHNHLHLHRDAMEIALEAGDRDGVALHAAALERFTAAEPLRWSRLVTSRARALVRHRDGGPERAELARLLDQVRRAGFWVAARALEEALSDGSRACYRNTVSR